MRKAAREYPRTLIEASSMLGRAAANVESRFQSKQFEASSVRTSQSPKPCFRFVYEINAVGWFHLDYFGLAIPYLEVSRARKFKDKNQPLPNRIRHFQEPQLLS
jgi:hypothetical protein